jgi:curved DNA-binding protein CbpA
MEPGISRPLVNGPDQGDQGQSANRQQKSMNSSPRTATREAEKWLMMNQVVDGPVRSWPEETEVDRLVSTPFLERRDDDVVISGATNLPASYVKHIQEAFGESADLYNDVLRISRLSSPRDLRIAYFRRGREVLSDREYSTSSGTAATVGGNVSGSAKQRFQAVSMAYEILSSPAWKDIYDSRGMEEKDSVKSSPTSAPSSPVLRRSSSLGRRSRANQNAVRWNEEVEELVFDQDPNEVGRDVSKKSDADQKRKRKGRKPKKRVVVDTLELQRHLEKLDQEAEKHFVSDFIDDLENSIEELLSLGSSKEENSKPLSRKPVSRKIPAVKAPEGTKEEQQGRALGQQGTTTFLDTLSKFYVDSPAPSDVVVPGSASSGRRAGLASSDDTVSTLSASVADRQLPLSSLTRPKGTEMAIVSEEMGNNQDETIILPPDLDPGCDPSDMWCGDDDDPSELVAHAEHQTIQDVGDSTPDFHVFLMTYLQSLAQDLYALGSSIQTLQLESTSNSMMDLMMISDEDLEEMLGILRKEMDRAG